MGEAISEEVPTERHHCMISTCSWYYETAARMTYTEARQAVEVGDLHGVEAGRDRLLLIDTAVRVHLETHPLLDWATEVHQQRGRADAAMTELAAKVGEADQLRAQLAAIGETKPEWAVRWLDGEIDIADSEGEARDQTHNDAGLTLLQRRVGKQWREVPDA